MNVHKTSLTPSGNNDELYLNKCCLWVVEGIRSRCSESSSVKFSSNALLIFAGSMRMKDMIIGRDLHGHCLTLFTRLAAIPFNFSISSNYKLLMAC